MAKEKPTLPSSTKGKLALSVAVGVSFETIDEWLSQVQADFPEEKVPAISHRQRGMGYRVSETELPKFGEPLPEWHRYEERHSDRS